ncbi:MAG: flagellar motor switch phosphatase FliY [Clostridiales bacterium]|jgi:flagellar motor switch protein FliN/FliY|nr:flagellar motor switch phosphatase FliY [Clostridiales bacterium]
MDFNDMLSQDEIDALLRNKELQSLSAQSLSSEEIDAIGEIGNIVMGTAATTLSTLINKKVLITTPKVTITTLKELAKQYPIPFVAVEVKYTEGLEGTNILIIQERDVKIITDLILGGDGTNIGGTITDMHLSAIGEVMNQMMGSACTSLSTMLYKNILISPPNTFIMDFSSESLYTIFDSDEQIVNVTFRMVVEGLIDSYMMQLIPIDFAKELLESLLSDNEAAQDAIDRLPQQQESSSISEPEKQRSESSPAKSQRTRPVDVRPVSFQPLEERPSADGKSNIDIILDVPLQVSVELGRTRKLIKEILGLSAGSVIELDKMAGDPVDILVNGKMIAKGEVVVIDDSFGVRITDIISPDKRISNLK